MRKLLLATVAGLGAWGAVATDADAQQMITPNYTGGASSPTAPTPQPGTVVVRLNGRVRFYAFATSDSDAENNVLTNTGISTTPLTGGNKLARYGFAEYARLYPGFDGIAANGLKYGANVEIRQDTSAPAGGGANGSISAQDPKRAQLYFRRVWGYLGTNELGTFRFGSIDQPTSLYLTGNYENFNDGGWNGDAPVFLPGALQVAWPFSDVGSYYTTNKVVYLSPQIFGFDLGASFEPSTANVSGSINCPTAAAPGCDTLSSSPNNAESARRRNTWDVLLRYRGSFGPVGVAATAAYIGGGHVLDNSGLGFTNNPLVAGGPRFNYDGLSIGDFGAAITWAGLSVGGHYSTGRFNGNVANTVPKGIRGTDAWLAGASYTFGPAIIGASYYVDESAGDLGNAAFGRDRREVGVAAGGTYSLAPGVSIFLSYLWGQRKQSGFNFLTGQGVTATSPLGNPNSNKVTGQVFSLGTAFSW
jgi:predicted porin